MSSQDFERGACTRAGYVLPYSTSPPRFSTQVRPLMATLATARAVDPAASVRCDEMLRLREEARQLQERLRESRMRARAHEREERRSGLRASHSNDYEGFLQRKLLKNALLIARHIAEHCCEELGHNR